MSYKPPAADDACLRAAIRLKLSFQANPRCAETFRRTDISLHRKSRPCRAPRSISGIIEIDQAQSSRNMAQYLTAALAGMLIILQDHLAITKRRAITPGLLDKTRCITGKIVHDLRHAFR